MPRKIVILERQGMPSDVNYRVAYWLDVPAARQAFYANATAASVVVGATADELAAIRTGAVVEVVETLARQSGTSITSIRAAARTRWDDLQSELVARNPYDRYGTTYDGTSWTAGGVA